MAWVIALGLAAAPPPAHAGDSPAVVPFEGSVRFAPASTLTIELGAPAPGRYDRLEIQGAFEAGGTLVVVTLPDFTGSEGDTYEIVTAASVTGLFAYVPPAVGAGMTLALVQTPTSIRLVVAADCDGNRRADSQEIAQDPARDCNGNLVLDVCELAGGGDTNANGYLDVCEVSTLSVTAATLSWSSLIVASVYDVVAGDLATLRATGGDFTAATQSCLADDQVGTSLAYTGQPATPGEGFWFLVRGVAGATALSFDSFAAGQAGSRDAGIAASPGACP